MQGTILLLRQQLDSLSNKSASGLRIIADNGVTSRNTCSDELLEKNPRESRIASCGETYGDENTPTSVMSLNRVLSLEDSKDCNNSAFCNSQVYMQVIPDLVS